MKQTVFFKLDKSPLEFDRVVESFGQIKAKSTDIDDCIEWVIYENPVHATQASLNIPDAYSMESNDVLLDSMNLKNRVNYLEQLYYHYRE